MPVTPAADHHAIRGKKNDFGHCPLGGGFVIWNANGDGQHFVAPDEGRQVPFAACVFKQADTARPEVAVAAIARAHGGLSGQHEHPLPEGRAMPAADPVRRESQEAPPRCAAHGGNIEWRCRRGKSL